MSPFFLSFVLFLGVRLARRLARLHEVVDEHAGGLLRGVGGKARLGLWKGWWRSNGEQIQFVKSTIKKEIKIKLYIYYK